MSHDIVLECHGCGARNKVHVERLGDAPVCGGCKRSLMAGGRPLELDDQSFAELVAASPKPVLVDFWASWCGPCRQFAPVLERFAKEQGDKVLVVKVNVDEARRAAATHQIRSIPTICVFQDGKEKARHVGGMSTTELLRMTGASAA